DRFRGRIIFPIRDARGRCTALGGRAMDPNARAKYLNSPETVLFDKGRSLYNHAPAREAAGKIGRLIVAEGYMDVIALAQAGFDHAVAPLGTAITEHQLAMIWRMCDEPVLALDGDKAGLRAAERLIDVALPLLEPGKSLRFVVLPEGQDPDDLIKAHGPNAMQTLLDRAQPMVQLLWARETRGQVFDSPERRAALDARLREKLRAIRDPGLRRHYGEAVRDLREGLFQGNRGPQARGPGGAGPGGWRPTLPRGQATQGTRSSLLAQGETAPARLREALILAAAMRAPRAALSMETALERLPFSDPEMGKIRDALLAALDMDLGVLSAREAIHRSMSDTLGFDPMAYVMSLPPVRIHPHLRDGAEEALVAQTLAEDLEKHAAVLGAEADLSEAEEELGGLANESLTWRIQQASAARAKATRASVAGGGTEEEDRENLSKQLQKLLDDEVWVKKGR
ncbi:MAG: toprim domain-containing protein, partial [Pseudomonadota bacterium]